jgi:putative membrane protein
MIRNYSDHAANERTFLAWVRTAIAIMAFGFLLERFDLFLQMAAVTLNEKAIHLPGDRFGRDAGFGLLLLGSAMMVVSALRFLKTARNIESSEIRTGSGLRVDIALAILLALLGLALVVYLSHAFMARE